MANEFENIEKVVEQASELYVNAIRNSAIEERLFKTGKLVQSIQGKTYNKENKVGLQISMEDYGIYQDSGVNGTEQPVPRSNQSLYPPGQFKSKTIGGPKEWSFVGRRAVAENGLKPRPFIVQGLRQVTENFLVPNLNEAGVKDIENYIELSVEKLSKVT